jgi:uncharacterized membrane protein
MKGTFGHPPSWSATETLDGARRRGSIPTPPAHDRDDPGTPSVRRISVYDLRDALWKGVEDFGACRTDVIALCLFYPVTGALLTWIAFDRDLVPLFFPLISGFALIGPVAGIGLYEMSRMREKGEAPNWGHAFLVVKSPSFLAVAVLGLLLGSVFAVWLLAAHGIYHVTLGPEPPASFGALFRDVFTTRAGWAMLILGCGVGLIFAALVLASSVISFPLLLDHDVGLPVAVITSLCVARANPRPIALWGLIVTAGLAIGSIPLFLGLIVVLPILGHATWHLYRRAVKLERRAG